MKNMLSYRAATTFRTKLRRETLQPPYVCAKLFWTDGWSSDMRRLEGSSERKAIPCRTLAVPIEQGRPTRTAIKAEPKDSGGEIARTEDPKETAVESCLHSDPALSDEQAHVVELAAKGFNIFYTGSAGSGKSTVLRAIVQRLTDMRKRVEVLAPTGRAALAIDGITTWTYAKWNPSSHKISLENLKKAANAKNSRSLRFQCTDVMIIDEISMVENLHFERLNQVMKVARVNQCLAANEKPLAFGGVQVIVTGDFAQLPPVRPFQHCIRCGGEMELDVRQEWDNCRRCSYAYRAIDKWAFCSKAWEECNFTYVHLKTIYRQSDNAFISLLEKCRLGEPFVAEEVDLLMNHESVTTGAVELYPTREEVRHVNEREFKKLPTFPRSFKCHDTFIWNKVKHPHLAHLGKRHPEGWLTYLREHNLDHKVELKTEMRVVLLVNLDLSKGLCNGSQGTIVGWTVHSIGPTHKQSLKYRYRFDPLANIKVAEIMAFEKEVDTAIWPIVRFINGEERIVRAECQVHELGDDKPYSLLCRTQIPLAPAWALTIHKAQGMTLDRVKVDLSRVFTEGQVYVALSRARNLQGLKVVGDAQGLMVGKGGNKEVRAFYKKAFSL